MGALNSNCAKVGGCGSTSPMVTWLKRALADNPAKCTLAYFHHPLFSSRGEHSDQPQVRHIWQALYAANADMVMGGHDHDYERFAPQRPDGIRDDSRGLRQFVAGTGVSPSTHSAKYSPTARRATPQRPGCSS